MIPIKGDHFQKIIINLIIFKKIDLTPVKIILMKETISKTCRAQPKSLRPQREESSRPAPSKASC